MSKYEQYLYKIFPRAVMNFGRKYFRLQVEGIENIPKKGPVIIVPNHSGFSGLDAMMLSYEIYISTGRIARVLAHKAWFASKFTAIPAEKVGFIKASMAEGLKRLEKKNIIVVFPEGEHGNFKPSVNRYKLAPFKNGFIRMALITQCPIVPTVIIGAEEANLNLAKLKNLPGGLSLPLPINFIPLPSRWKIKFLPPVEFPYQPSSVDDRELVEELVDDVRERLQSALSQELQSRPKIF